VNLETLPDLARLQRLLADAQITWPMLCVAVAIGWLFVRLGMRWLPRVWLRWPAALLVGAIAWIPFQQVPLGSYAAPWGTTLSVFSVLLMLAAVQSGREALLPAAVWALLLLAGIALGLEQFGWVPWQVHSWGYRDAPSRAGQIVVLAFLLALVLLIALKRVAVALLALLPALLWRMEAAPSPNFWEAYIDFPLTLAALAGLLGFVRRRHAGERR